MYRRLLGIVGLLSLAGCFQQIVSTADLPRNTEPGGRGQLLTPGLGVIIRTSNETDRSWSRKPSGFEISLWFAPMQKGFQFDPHRTRLLLSDRVFLPKQVVTVSRASDPTRAHTFSCWSNDRSPIPGEAPYELRLGYCFELYYDVMPPSPDTSFSLHLDGLSKDDKALSVSQVQFKRGSFRVFPF